MGWDEVRERLDDRLGNALGDKLGDKLGDGLGDRLGDNECKILKVIWENPASSIPEIAQKVGISTTAVENNLKKLRVKELIGRVGTVWTFFACDQLKTVGSNYFL